MALFYESSLPQPTKTGADVAGGGAACPICAREVVSAAVSFAALSVEVQALIRANAPDSKALETVCPRCVQLFERAKNEIISDAAVQKDGSHVLSTALRLDADERFTGKDVTIAFLDSGFYPHVDFGVSQFARSRRRHRVALSARRRKLARHDDIGRRCRERRALKRFLSRTRARSQRRFGKTRQNRAHYIGKYQDRTRMGFGES